MFITPLTTPAEQLARLALDVTDFADDLYRNSCSLGQAVEKALSAAIQEWEHDGFYPFSHLEMPLPEALIEAARSSLATHGEKLIQEHECEIAAVAYLDEEGVTAPMTYERFWRGA